MHRQRLGSHRIPSNFEIRHEMHFDDPFHVRIKLESTAVPYEDQVRGELMLFTLFFLRSCRGRRWGPISQFAQSKLPDVVESMAGRPPWMWEQLRVHEYDRRPGEVRLQSSLAVDEGCVRFHLDSRRSGWLRQRPPAPPIVFIPHSFVAFVKHLAGVRRHDAEYLARLDHVVALCRCLARPGLLTWEEELWTATKIVDHSRDSARSSLATGRAPWQRALLGLVSSPGDGQSPRDPGSGNALDPAVAARSAETRAAESTEARLRLVRDLRETLVIHFHGWTRASVELTGTASGQSEERSTETLLLALFNLHCLGEGYIGQLEATCESLLAETRPGVSGGRRRTQMEVVPHSGAPARLRIEATLDADRKHIHFKVHDHNIPGRYGEQLYYRRRAIEVLFHYLMQRSAGDPVAQDRLRRVVEATRDLDAINYLGYVIFIQQRGLLHTMAHAMNLGRAPDWLALHRAAEAQDDTYYGAVWALGPGRSDPEALRALHRIFPDVLRGLDKTTRPEGQPSRRAESKQA